MILRKIIVALPVIVTVILLAACVPASNFDPNLAAIQAQQQAQLYSAMATGTAGAQIIPITQTAAAFSFDTTKTSVDLTSTAIFWTATATAIPTITMTSTPDLTQTVAVENLIVIRNQNAADQERREINNRFWAVAPAILFVLFIFGAAYIAITYSRSVRRKTLVRDEQGKIPVVMDSVTGETFDLSANPNYTHMTKSLIEQMFIQWLIKNHGFVPDMPLITAGRQDVVKEREQIIEYHRNTRGPLPKSLVQAQALLPAPADEEDQLAMFPLPEWNLFSHYPFEQGGAFPFGSYQTELARINLNDYPHVGLIGPTGSGKSRLFLRPFIASALASGNRVIVLGDMVDFVVFKAHPNATLIPIYQITKPEDAAQYISALQIINAEMDRRIQRLSETGESTWARQGGENTLFVLDELGPNVDILDDTNPSAARVLRGFLSLLINKGRKAGFNFIFAGTRAVGLKKQLSQVSTIAFRLKDTDEERYAFGQSGYGANHTPKSYYLTKIGSEIQMTGSFNPSDEQLLEFIFTHQTKVLPKPTWIEGVFSNIALPVQAQAEKLSAPVSTTEFVNSLSPWQVQALDLYQEGIPQADIVEKLFAGDDPRIGTAAVADLIQRWQAVKGVTPGDAAAAESKTVGVEQQIQDLRAQGLSPTNIVYKLFGKSGSNFAENMAKVKSVLDAATASTSNGPQSPLAA